MRTLTIVFLACIAAQAQTSLVETFDGGSNQGGWTYGLPASFPTNGGHPGSYLLVSGLDTFAPIAATTETGVFTGNFHQRQILTIGVDLITHSVDFSAGGRPLTLMLFHDNGTPGDPKDDTAAFFMGPNIPQPGEGWLSYDFAVPSQSDTLPQGWELLNLGDSGSPAQHTWAQVMANVNQVSFFYGDPRLFFIFQMWTVGMDNVRIQWGTLTGDLDGNNFVDVRDLVLVVSSLGTCPAQPEPCPADLDINGTVDQSDLLIGLSQWRVSQL